MRAVRFVVEAVVESIGIVLCRCSGVPDFKLTGQTTLNGARVRSFDIPRKLLPDGSQDVGIFGFVLAERGDVSRFAAGQEVLLENP